MFSGYATPTATERYATRFSAQSHPGFYRSAQHLKVSSLGIGTYLGHMNQSTDEAYAAAIQHALERGVNFIDTSLNYRHQHSEMAVSRAVSGWVADGGGSREEVVIATKAGYLVPDAIPTVAPGEVAGGMHCLAPAFLSDQLTRSRTNLGLDTVDIFYLHNPETQLSYVPEEAFYLRIRVAFELLEHLVETGEIRHYGTATWDGFRRGDGPRSLSLVRLNRIANEIAGEGHHFRFIQLPVNLAMTEAFTKPLEQNRTVLELADEMGITVVSSASLLQARLARGLPDEVAAALPGTTSDAQRAIQFARSVPGVAVALVGMSNEAHVDENVGVAAVGPLAPEEFRRAFA